MYFDPISIFVPYMLLDGIYQSLWYVKSSIYRQNIKQQFSRFIKKEERYIYYLFVSFLIWNLKLLLWVDAPTYLYEFPLSLPPVLTIVTEHPLFREQYQYLCDYLAIKFGDFFCICLCNLINLTGIHIFNQPKRIISYEETRNIYESLSTRAVLLIIKTIVFGFVYDVFFHYLYSIFSNRGKRDRYVDEILGDIKAKRWDNIVSVTGISKIFCIYYETEHEWFYKKLGVLKEKLWLESLRVSSYWSLMAFISNISGSNLYGILVVVLLLNYEERSSIDVGEVVLYLVCFSILASNNLIVTLLLMYLKKIEINVEVQKREHTIIVKILVGTFVYSMIRNRGAYSGVLQGVILGVLGVIYMLAWNRRYLIEKIDIIEMYYVRGLVKKNSGGGEDNGKVLERSIITDYF